MARKAPAGRKAAGSAAKTSRAPAKRTKKTAAPADVDSVLERLRSAGSARIRDEMGPRYGIIAKKAYGVPMAKIIALGKSIGTDHDLARKLWKTGVYEARLLVSKIGDPEKLTLAEMNGWAKDFDNWAVVDTLCFHFFDKSPHAFAMVDQWAKRTQEFEKRAAFALLACLALHGKGADQDYVKRLPLIERAASDERNFVRKAVAWALRAVGGKKSPKLRAAARDLARRLAGSEDASERWVGKEALREFAKADAKR